MFKIHNYLIIRNDKYFIILTVPVYIIYNIDIFYMKDLTLKFIMLYAYKLYVSQVSQLCRKFPG